MNRRTFLQSILATCALTTGLARASIDVVEDKFFHEYPVVFRAFRTGEELHYLYGQQWTKQEIDEIRSLGPHGPLCINRIPIERVFLP